MRFATPGGGGGKVVAPGIIRDMAEQVPAVSNVLDAIERRDWKRFKRLLHPDIH